MANNKFKAAVKKAKSLYKSGKYKKFSDAVKAAYKKAPRRKKKMGAVKRKVVTVRRVGRITRKRKATSNSTKAGIEKKLSKALLDHWKTQSIKRTRQLDKTIASYKKKLKNL